MNGDQELRGLLKDNERSRQLSGEEKLRLQRRLGIETEEVVDFDHTEQSRSAAVAGGRRRSSVLLATSVAAVLVIALAVLSRSESTRIDASQPPADGQVLAMFCASELTETAAALEAWTGVLPWAWTDRKPEPDLGALTLNALTALEAVGAEGSGEETNDIAQRLAEVLAEEPRPAGSGPAGARADALEEALVHVSDRVRELDTQGICDVERLDAGLELDD